VFGFARTAETGFHSGEGLYLERDMLDDVSHPGTAFYAHKATAYAF
jgi:hypothetical protein